MSISSYTCGAKTRSGTPCQNVPMVNGRYVQPLTGAEAALARMIRERKREL